MSPRNHIKPTITRLSLCIFSTSSGFRAGHVVWIYDFEGFSHRDYDKPAADTVRGMLPPQLARVMLNLATGGQGAIYDPFCGVGALLIESTLLGHRSFGSDLDPQAIAGANQNLAWSAREYPDSATYDLTVHDATTPLPSGEPVQLVTEGYLGELVQPTWSDAELESRAQAVGQTLEAFLNRAGESQSPGQRLVITLPVWRLRRGLRRLSVVDRAEKYGYTKVRPLPQDMKLPGLTDRDTIDVARPQARVIHEIAILERT